MNLRAPSDRPTGTDLRPRSLAISTVVFVAALTWGTPITTVGDIFLISGSLKYGDVIIVALTAVLTVDKAFRREYARLVLLHRLFVLLIAALVVASTMSVFAAAPNLQPVTFEHFAWVARLSFYGHLVLLVATVSRLYNAEGALLSGLLLGLAFVAAYTVISTYLRGESYLGDFIKISSERGANPIGTYSAFLLPVPLYYAVYARRRLVKVGSVVVSVLLVGSSLATFAKASWLTMLATAIIFFAWRLRYLPRGRLRAVLLTVIGLGVLLSVFGDVLLEVVRLEIRASGGNTEQRLSMYGEALGFFKERPLLGLGVQNYPNFDPHTIYGQMLAVSGLVGFLPFLAIFFYPALTIVVNQLHLPSDPPVRPPQVLPAILSLGAIYGMGFFTGTAFTLHIFWIMTGIVLAYSQSPKVVRNIADVRGWRHASSAEATE